MGIFERLLTPRADVSWNPLDERWYQPIATFASNFAGFPIGPDMALRVSAVFACCSLIAETVASLPVILYRRLPDGGKEKARDHRLYRTLRYKPNGWMSAADFYAAGQMHVGLRGNMYYAIDDRELPVQLVPLHPDLMRVEEVGRNRLRYTYTHPKEGKKDYTQEEILHISDLRMDGMAGQARAALAREAIAVAAAAEAYVGGFFKNDATGRLLIKHPSALSPEKRQAFREMLQENYAGWANRSKAMLLTNGVDAEELGKHDDSGFIIDPRKFQVSDIARFWRVPSFMIGMEEKNTAWGTGIEQMTLGFVTFTIKSWTDRWAQAMMARLLTEEEQEEYVIEHQFADLLRGDLKSRSEALEIQKRNGVINPNEWRALENMNPRDGGDDYQENPPGAAPSSARMANSWDPLLADAASRIAGAEVREVIKRQGKAEENFTKWQTWVRTFYAEHREYAKKVISPIVGALNGDIWIVETVSERIERTAVLALSDNIPDAWCDQRRAEVLQILEETLAASERIAA